MDLHLALDGAGPPSVRLTDALREAVRGGRLPAGTRLPSSRALAGDLGVSRGVVVRAYEQLVAEGFLVSRQGDGTRVAALPAFASGAGGRTSAERCEPPLEGPPGPSTAGRGEPPAGGAGTADGAGAAGVGTAGGAGTATGGGVAAASGGVTGPGAAGDAGAEPPGIAYDLRPGKPDLTAFPRARWAATLREALRDLPHDALGYPDPAGVPELRAELAGYLARVRAAVATPGTVVVTSGVAQVLALLPRVLVADGHRLLAVEDPLAHQQIPLLRAAGVELAGVPVDAEGIDVAALARTRARAVLVTPAHQFPTGVVLSPRRRAALAEWARTTGALIIEDDYDGEFRYDRDPVGCLQGLAPDQVVLAGSASKALSPALRLGWAVAPPRLARRLRAARALHDLGSSALDQHVLARLIGGGGYDRHLRAMRRRYRARRDAFVAALGDRLPGARVLGVSAGLHVYVELPDGCDEAGTVGAAAARGVAVEGVARMRVRRPGPPALVAGYARLPERRLAEAAELLAVAVTYGTGGVERAIGGTRGGDEGGRHDES